MTKTLLLSIILSSAALAATARDAMTINEGWDFRLPSSGQYTRVNLPHTYNLDAYTTRKYYRGQAEYRRTLGIDSIDPGCRYFLRFDGANKAATVTVNGHALPEHRSGYTAFTLDVTPFIRQGENIIEVTVDNSRIDIPPHSADFTFSGGLYRDAWLVTAPAIHFDLADHGSTGIYITPEVTAEKADVAVRARVANDTHKPADIIVTSSLFNPDGTKAGESKSKLSLKPGLTEDVAIKLPTVTNPELWSPEKPTLYSLVTTIADSKTGHVIERDETPVGLRFFEFSGPEGFFLNGKHYKLRGVNRHQDLAPMGPAITDEAHRRDVELMKDMGANFVRLAHYPQDDAILRHCDRLGLLVWEEIPVVNLVVDHPDFDDNAETALIDMIRQHYNHPSVIGWGYMNEVLLAEPRPFQKTVRDRTLALAKRLEAKLHEEDPSRASMTAFGGAELYNDAGLGITDAVGWNLYQGWYGGKLSGFERYLEDQRDRFPERSLIVSEWGAGSDRRLHSASPVLFDFSIDYQQKYIEHYLPYIEKSDYIAGGAYWNFIDFNVASRQESMPRVNNKGLVSNDRAPKDVYYYFKSAWRPELPTVHIATRDRAYHTLAPESDSITVKVYTNAGEVELFADGHSLGRQPVVNYNAIFRAALPAGRTSLTAVAGQAVDVTTIDIRPTPSLARGEQLAVNVGSNCDFISDHTGTTWLADRPYSPGGWGYLPGGKKVSTTAEVFNTLDTPLYQTRLDSIKGYRFDCPPGRYEVELLFADVTGQGNNEPYLLDRATESVTGAVAAPTMAITLNGRTVDPSFTPSAGGFRQAVRRKFTVDNTDGHVTIGFTPVTGQTSLSAVLVMPR